MPDLTNRGSHVAESANLIRAALVRADRGEIQLDVETARTIPAAVEATFCPDELESRYGLPPIRCYRAPGHPGWHAQPGVGGWTDGATWGDAGERHGERDPWTGEARAAETEA